MGGRTVILKASQGGGIGRREERAIGVKRPRCVGELEDVSHGFWNHDGERMSDR